MPRRIAPPHRVVVAAASLLASGACGVADRPSSVPRDLPAAATSYLEPTGVWRARLAPGVVFRSVTSPIGPWAVFLLELDLARCDVVLDVVSAAGAAWGRARVSEMARSARGTVAGVNAGFFTPEGQPLGVEVSEGRVAARGSRPALAWHPGRAPWIGQPTARADSVLQLGWPLRLGAPDGLTEAVAGFPELLDASRRVGDLAVTSNPDFAGERHPRTAFGVTEAGDTAWVVVVDGRREGHSVGMTLPELTGLLEALGAADALNLDGGGSSVMTVGAAPVNRPSDASGERAVANALLIRSDRSSCPGG